MEHRKDSIGIKISIVGSKTRLNLKYSPFVVYIIEILDLQASRAIYIDRRYSQFHALDSGLRALQSKTSLPELPGKQLIKSSNKNIVKTREKALQLYLEGVLNSPLGKTEVFLKWIHPSNNPEYISFSNPIIAGNLLKRGHLVRNWKDRYLVIVNETIYYFKSKDVAIPKGGINLHKAVLEIGYGGIKSALHSEKIREFCFKIIPYQPDLLSSSSSSLSSSGANDPTKLQGSYLCAYNKEQFDLWIKTIRSIINKSKIPSLLSNNINKNSSSNLNNNNSNSTTTCSSGISGINTQTTINRSNVMPTIDIQTQRERRRSKKLNHKTVKAFDLNSSSFSHLYLPTNSFSSDALQKLEAAKHDIDSDLKTYLLNINKLRSQVNEGSYKANIYNSLNLISKRFLESTIYDLLSPNYCNDIINEIFLLKKRYMNEVLSIPLITNLLFIISPISRLITQYHLANKPLTSVPPIISPSSSSSSSSSIQISSPKPTSLFKATSVSSNTPSSPRRDELIGFYKYYSNSPRPTRNHPLTPQLPSPPPPPPPRPTPTPQPTNDNNNSEFTIHTHTPLSEETNQTPSEAIEMISSLIDTLSNYQIPSSDDKSSNSPILGDNDDEDDDDEINSISSSSDESDDDDLSSSSDYEGTPPHHQQDGSPNHNSIIHSPSSSSTSFISSSSSSQIVGIESFEIVKSISSGAFGKVNLVKLKGSTDVFAMKILRKKVMIAKNLVTQVQTERNILAALENPYVVKLHYAFHDEKNLYLIMEYLNGGDCASLLEHVGCFTEEMARIYIAETILAIGYLHTKGIVHRDVKPDNLLINASGHIKLTDFGLSQQGLLNRNNNEAPKMTRRATVRYSRINNDKTYKVVGTPDYLSPEALLGTGIDESVDWWAVGVTLYEFLTGIPPFNDDSIDKIFHNILQRDIMWPSIPDEMSEEAQDLIDSLLAYDPENRLGHGGIEEIKSHRFFEGVDWDNLYKESRDGLFVPQVRDEFDTAYFVDRNDGRHQSEVLSEEDKHKLDKHDFAGFSFRNLQSLMNETPK